MFFDGYGHGNPLVMTAAGLCKSFDLATVGPLVRAADLTVVGSFTLNARAGNTGRCEHFGTLYSVNSWGMPNPGANPPELPPEAAEQHRRWRDRIVVSIAEFSPDGYRRVVERLWQWGAAVELNLSCPNIRDNNTQHRIIGFDPEMVAQTLVAVAGTDTDAPVIVKLPPYSDPWVLRDVAATIAEVRRPNGKRLVQAVSATNTFPNGCAYTPDHRPALETLEARQWGGIGGEALKPISLANAAQLRQSLPEDVAVIRVGGISTGEDLWQSCEVGCVGVQVHTAIAMRGLGVLHRIRQEYADIIG